MYLPQFQEICEKQGWDFKWSDDGESAYITLMTLPNKHLFIVNKNNFAKEVTALSEHIYSMNMQKHPALVLRFSARILQYLQHSALSQLH